MTNLQMRADWTTQPEYYIDFARGSIYHSQTASRGQIHRIFSDKPVGGKMKHLNYAQMTDIFKKGRAAQFYLILLRSL